ncbi:MAG: serine protease [Bdellovibrionota bacterium]
MNIFKALIVSVLLGSVGQANDTFDNPNFLRLLANPATYRYAPKYDVKFKSNFNINSICGVNNLQHVSEYDGLRGQPIEFVKMHQHAVAAIAKGSPPATSKYCSGTMISEDLFLTAAHCVSYDILNEYVVFNYQKINGVVDLNMQEHFTVNEIVEQGINKLDYAILRINGKPGLKYGFTKININEVPEGTTLTIVQHPMGNPKMVDIGRRQGIRGDNYMTYGDLDTQGGSSGSGVLDQNGLIVAVHTHGGCTSSGGENGGTLMTKIALASKVVQELTGAVSK